MNDQQCRDQFTGRIPMSGFKLLHNLHYVKLNA